MGGVQFWVRRDDKIWLRDTPANSTTSLVLSVRFHPAEITRDDLNTSPVPPFQYHMAIVKLAASNYFTLHPPMVDGVGTDYARATALQEQVLADISTLRSPVAEEQKDRRDYVRQGGYDFNVR